MNGFGGGGGVVRRTCQLPCFTGGQATGVWLEPSQLTKPDQESGPGPAANLVAFILLKNVKPVFT